MQKNIKLFKTTLKDLNIKRVYTDDFTPEQIFFQLKEATEDRIKELEQKINCELKKKFKTGLLDEDNDISADLLESESTYESLDSYSKDDLENLKSISSEVSESDNDFENEESEVTVSNQSILNEENLEEQAEEISLDYESEETVSFDEIDWNNCDVDDELLNKPADEVLKLLGGVGKKNKKY